LLNPAGYYCARGNPKEWVRARIQDASVIHCHDDCYPYRIEQRLKVKLDDKVLVYHAHIGNIPERYFFNNRRFHWDERVKHVCITNGYGRLFDEDETQHRKGRALHKWGRLPDILDLNHPSYRPWPVLREPYRKGEKLRVIFTYSNNREGDKINAKRPLAHRRLFHRIHGIDFITMAGKPFEEAQALKRTAHVVLEECFTPFLHLSALEGAALGAMILTNFDDYTKRELCTAVGSPVGEFPFYKCTDKTLRAILCKLRDNPDIVNEWGEKAQRWMFKYYRPEQLLERYIGFYTSGI